MPHFINSQINKYYEPYNSYVALISKGVRIRSGALAVVFCLVIFIALAYAEVSGQIYQQATKGSFGLGSMPSIAPNSVVDYVPIVISNKKSNTGADFQQLIVVNSSAYSAYEANDMSNVEFFYGSGTVIPSWLENGSSSSSAVYWLKIYKGIGRNANITIYMGFAPKNVSVFGSDAGESPLLSPKYGEYDNGANVFTLYDNFVGASSVTKWLHTGNVSIDNGLTIGATIGQSDSYLWSTSRYQVDKNVTETYGTLFAKPLGSKSYFGYIQYPLRIANSLYWYGQFGKLYATVSNSTYLNVFASLTHTPGNVIYGLYAQKSNAHAFYSGLGEETHPHFEYSTANGTFNGAQSLLVGVPMGSNSSVKFYFIRQRVMPPDGAMPDASFGILRPVSGSVILSMQSTSVSYGSSEIVSAFGGIGESVELFMNGNMVAGPSRGSVSYALPIISAGNYSIVAINLKTKKTAAQTLTVRRTLPPIVISGVPRSFNYNGISASAYVTLYTPGNQITANVYLDGNLISAFATNAVVTVGPGVAMHLITVNTTQSANYIAAEKEDIVNIYPNGTPKHVRHAFKHIVIITQENRAFDNYFGSYPGAAGFPANACEPYDPLNLSKGCVKPWLSTDATIPDLGHYWSTTNKAYDNGKMDGFIYAAKGSTLPMIYYDNNTIPDYWAMAEHYVLTDHMFSSELSFSLPNHWYEIAANAPLISKTSSFTAIWTSPAARYTYLNQSNFVQTTADELEQKNISWAYYSPGENYNYANFITTYNAAVNSTQVTNFWNPLLAKNSTYTSAYLPHIRMSYQIFSDLATNSLPAVSWVVPRIELSDHPPANITMSSWYVSDLVDHIENSSYWNSTVIVVLWDDYGGFYDSIPPKQVDQYGLSFRVPGLIISAYSKQNFIDNTTYSFESTMKFIEKNWNLSALTQRDANASDMMNAFYFNQSPSTPYIIPLNQSELNVINPLIFNSSVATDAVVGGAADNGTIVINGFTENVSDFDT